MHATKPATGPPTGLRVGDLVEVRSADEIRATLDENGELDALPFMPEMFGYCGRRLTVYKVAHKLCDTIEKTGFRRMEQAVHLSGVRCDGQAHGGCQAGCLVYWKTAWLKRIDPAVAGPAPDPGGPAGGTRTAAGADPGGRTLLSLLTRAARGRPAPDGAETWRCQATEMSRAAPQRLPVRDLQQYAQDVRYGNVGPFWAARALLIAVFNRLQDASRRLPRQLRFRGGLRWGFLRGTATTTPTARTDLRPGELVRVRSKPEIMRTLNAELHNRGLGFDVEMTRFCGRTARVARRVDQIIDERTGRMLHMRYPCIVLDGVVCEGAYSSNCPRAIHAYWRELWLERVEQVDGSDAGR